MKKTLKIFIAAAMAISLIASVSAQGAGPVKGGKLGQEQGGKPGQQQGGRRMALMNMDAEILKKLDLTADQQKAIKALKEKTAAKMKEVFESAKGDREGMREKARPIMEGYQKGMEKILTPAQQAEYKKLMKEAREKMRRGGPGGPGGPGKGTGGGKPGRGGF